MGQLIKNINIALIIIIFFTLGDASTVNLSTTMRQSSKIKSKNGQWSNSTYNDAWDNVDLDAINPEEDQTVKEIDHIAKETTPMSSKAQTD